MTTRVQLIVLNGDTSHLFEKQFEQDLGEFVEGKPNKSALIPMAGLITRITELGESKVVIVRANPKSTKIDLPADWYMVGGTSLG